MMKLKHYLKPYVGYIALMLLLLFCQAAVDLNLPNMMSNIVNIGIQRSGITETAPDVISRDSLSFMTRFMSKADSEQIAQLYAPVDFSAMTENERSRFAHTWPNAQSLAAFQLLDTQSPDSQAQADAIFGRACYALMHFVQTLSASTDRSVPAGDTESVSFDSAQFAKLAAMLDTLPPEMISDAIDVAADIPSAMTEQTASVFTKGFYLELGTDISARQTRYIFSVGGKMLLLTLALVCCALGTGFCGSRLGTGVARDLRRDVFTRVTSFTSNEYDRFGTASLITRTSNDVMQIRGLLSMGLRVMFYAPIIGIGGIFMAMNKSAGMAWVIALAAAVIFGVILVLFSVAIPRFKIMQKLVDKLNLVSRENLSGMLVIRAFATQKFEENRFAKANKELADNNLFVYRAMAVMMPTMMFIMNLISLLIVWVGGHQIAEASMQVGDMMAFIQYTMQIIMSFLMISMIFVMIPRAAVSANRIAEVLQTESPIQDPKAPEHLAQPVQGVIRFNDVSFRYDGASENVLEHVSFTARPGQTTAFIGSTGSGKSTLVNLIPRFYDVTEGSITLDGVDIRNLPQQELRDAIGYVPQKGVLFSGDIASNLRMGCVDAQESVLNSACDTAQATEFISTLPQGLHTPISQGGTNVSGGQRQRLSIARALVKDAPVYIFDDTFSALDFKTDASLRAALKQRTGSATMLIVAQRVSTIMHAEQIIVLDEGRVVGIGTHQQLLEHCSTYREIAQSQLSKEELA